MLLTPINFFLWNILNYFSIFKLFKFVLHIHNIYIYKHMLLGVLKVIGVHNFVLIFAIFRIKMFTVKIYDMLGLELNNVK